jgi:ABC-type transport system involved in cytochrome bd biosynthesis fused ATPase/permease subunit
LYPHVFHNDSIFHRVELQRKSNHGVFEVAKMLADTVETVENYYAQFVPAARDAVQSKMDSGVGIEE